MKFILLAFFLIGLTTKINLTNSLTISGEIYTNNKITNNQLAKKYCDALEKNLFKGLDKESILKYEYYFSSLPDKYIEDEDKFLEILKSDVKSICSYNFSKSNEKELKSFLENYLKTRSNTPKTKVEEINPTPINPAMIPVLR
tara:strand:+ start:50 stop:478 length:429 start_codon:yes stop_codon:yes gene_type:complete